MLLNGYKPVTRNLEVRIFSEDLLVGFEGFNSMFCSLDMTHWEAPLKEIRSSLRKKGNLAWKLKCEI